MTKLYTRQETSGTKTAIFEPDGTNQWGPGTKTAIFEPDGTNQWAPGTKTAIFEPDGINRGIRKQAFPDQVKDSRSSRERRAGQAGNGTKDKHE